MFLKSQIEYRDNPKVGLDVSKFSKSTRGFSIVKCLVFQLIIEEFLPVIIRTLCPETRPVSRLAPWVARSGPRLSSSSASPWPRNLTGTSRSASLRQKKVGIFWEFLWNKLKECQSCPNLYRIYSPRHIPDNREEIGAKTFHCIGTSVQDERSWKCSDVIAFSLSV